MQVFGLLRSDSFEMPLLRLLQRVGGVSLVLLLMGMMAAPLAQCREIPQFKGYVNDYANMISDYSESRIEQALRSFENSDSTQVVVLTVDSLEGDPLADFSIRVAEKWGVGVKGKDNGVLLLVAKKERQTRIEVGYGLEGVLTDLLAGRIIDDVINPLFKKGHFDEGFEAGVVAVIKATRGQFKAERGVSRRGGRGTASPLASYLVLGAIFVGFMGSVSRRVGVVAGAVMLPLAVLFGLPTAIGWLALLLLVPVGGLGGLLLPLIAASYLRHGTGFGVGGGYYGGRYHGGGFGGGGFGGGFGGGGGGGFGGGGASGGW